MKNKEYNIYNKVYLFLYNITQNSNKEYNVSYTLTTDKIQLVLDSFLLLDMTDIEIDRAFNAILNSFISVHVISYIYNNCNVYIRVIKKNDTDSYIYGIAYKICNRVSIIAEFKSPNNLDIVSNQSIDEVKSIVNSLIDYKLN